MPQPASCFARRASRVRALKPAARRLVLRASYVSMVIGVVGMAGFAAADASAQQAGAAGGAQAITPEQYAEAVARANGTGVPGVVGNGAVNTAGLPAGNAAGFPAANVPVNVQPAASNASGMIAIPGNGERGGAAAASNASGMISIPGNGERGAATAAAAPDTDSPGVITIPGNGEAAAAAPSPTMPIRTVAQAPRYVPPMPSAAVMSNAARAANAALSAPTQQSTVGGFQRVSLQPSTNNRAVVPVTITQQPVSAARAMPLPNAAPNGRYANASAAPAASATNRAMPPGFVAPAVAQAPVVAAGQQDGEAVRATAQAFLEQQSAGLPGKITITVPPVFPRGLAACASLEPFMPPGARMWGHTTVGVRCIGARPWTLYVQARIAMEITYYVAARQMMPNEVLAAVDLMPRDGDLANLPQTVITDPSQAIGAVALSRISAGLPLRTDMLRSQSAVVIGQTVRVIAVGSDFSISAEGSVMNNAAPGQQVQVRTSGGQIITGVVKDAGTVEVQI